MIKIYTNANCPYCKTIKEVLNNNKIKFNLLYDKNRSLQKKIKIEQIRRETSQINEKN